MDGVVRLIILIMLMLVGLLIANEIISRRK